jgi:hypothetical protein
MDNQVGEVMGILRSDQLWREYWIPLRAAVETGEITRESALRQWNAILHDEFAKKAQGQTWNG